MIYPLVRFGHLIGKNTAEFTTTDLVNFTKWWMKQPNSKEVLQAIKNQQIRAAKVGQELQSNRKEGNMSKGSKQENAYRSRLSPEQIEEVEEVVDEEAGEVGEVPEGSEVVATLDLTRNDIDALVFSITRTFEDYEMEAEHPHTISLSDIKEGLEGVE